jgi:hypothetical protein
MSRLSGENDSSADDGGILLFFCNKKAARTLLSGRLFRVQRLA